MVAGYSVEYSSGPFAFYFIAEYCNIIIWSFVTSLLFLGAWYTIIFSGFFSYTIKALFIMIFFCWVRAALPRYRWDQLMLLAWRAFLPMVLIGVFFSYSFFEFSNSDFIISLMSFFPTGKKIKTILTSVSRSFFLFLKKPIFVVFLIFLTLLLVTLLVVYWPLIGFLIGLLSSIGLMFLNIDISYYIFQDINVKKTEIIRKFLQYLKNIKMLEIFVKIYIFFYCVSPLRFFIYVGAMCFFNVIYIILSRYNLLIKNFSYEFSFYENHIYIFYFLLYLGLFFIYLRLILLIITSIVNRALVFDPLLISGVLFCVTPDASSGFSGSSGSSSSSSSSSSAAKAPKYSLIHFNYFSNRQYHKHFYDEAFNNMRRQRNVGLCVGILGCLTGIVTAKFTFDQVRLNEKQIEVQQAQVRAQEVNNFEMTHQNDLTKVEFGLMSKDEYYKKYPKK